MAEHKGLRRCPVEMWVPLPPDGEMGKFQACGIRILDDKAVHCPRHERLLGGV